MISLLIAIGALALGPIALQFLQRHAQPGRAMMLTLGLLVAILVVLILEHTVHEGGLIALLFALVGFVLPLGAERAISRSEWTIHRITMALGILGLLLHAISDGAALAAAALDQSEADALALQAAIILHRLPMGLAIWWLMNADFSPRLAITSLTLMALATIVGYVVGDAFFAHISETGRAWFIAFAAGSLLHLATHRLGKHDHHHD